MGQKITKLLPLGGETQGNDSTGYSMSRAVSEVNNFVPVRISPSLADKQVKYIKRRGFTAGISAASGYWFTAGMQWTGNPGTSDAFSRGVVVYVADKPTADLKLYQYDSSETTLGTFGTADYRCVGIQETLISNVATLTLNIKKTSTPYNQKALYYSVGGSLTEITDSDFPSTTIGNFTHLDGYAIIASTDGYLYNSDINSVSSWTANNRIAVQMEPDALVGTAKIGNLVAALGTKSIELFRNKGFPSGSPLESIKESFVRIGVLHQRAVIEVNGGIMFVGVSQDGFGVYFWNGSGQPQKISNTLIDNQLSGFADRGENTPTLGPLFLSHGSEIFIGGVVNLFGSQAVSLMINGARSLYFPKYDLWTTFAVAGEGQIGLFFNVGVDQYFLDVSASGTQGKITNTTILAAGSGSDLGYTGSVQFPAYITTHPFSFGTPKKKFFHSLRIIGDYVDTTSTPIVVSYSDDNGATYTTWGTINMNQNPPVVLTRGGSSRKRIFKFSNTSADGCAIEGVEIVYSVGNN